ncbi:MAG: ester cyclase [Chloroflexota bacterium]
MADVKDTAERFVTAFNSHDEKAIEQLHADNIKFEAPGGVRLEGKTAATQYAMGWLKAFPDGKMTIRKQIVSDPWVVQEFTMEGTHTGVLDGPAGKVLPTGKRLSNQAVSIVRYDNGRQTEVHLYYDQAAVMTQLGLMPTPATV